MVTVLILALVGYFGIVAALEEWIPVFVVATATSTTALGYTLYSLEHVCLGF